MGTQDRSTLADRHEHGYARCPFGFRTEVMREPRDDDTDGRVCPAGDAKHGKVPRVRVGRHDQYDQIPDRSEEA